MQTPALPDLLGPELALLPSAVRVQRLENRCDSSLGKVRERKGRGLGWGWGEKKKADAKQTQVRTYEYNKEPRATIMFSMKLRQMEKLNPGQSFGRESNDLNVLA